MLLSIDVCVLRAPRGHINDAYIIKPLGMTRIPQPHIINQPVIPLRRNTEQIEVFLIQN